MTENFVEGTRRLVKDSVCDVILAMGVAQRPVLLDPAWVEREVGVPVVERIGAPLRMAAMLAGLHLRDSPVHWRHSRAFERSATP